MAQYTHSSEDMKIKWVCRKCLENDPSNKSLLTVYCLDKDDHGYSKGRGKIRVWWRAGERNHLEIYDERMPGGIPEIRPMPSARFHGKFYLCNRGSRCLGKKCNFAHSIEERDVWNAKKFQSKYVSYPKPVPNKSNFTSDPPLANSPREYASLQPQHGQLMVQKELKRPLLQEESERSLEAVLREKLTPHNYKQKFLALISCERDAHIQELERRCNGKYTLVIDSKIKFMMNWQESQRSNLCGYLVGLDGDQIAYCTQASEGINLQGRGNVNCRAEFLRANNRQIDDKLYVHIVTRVAKFEKELEVNATFDLKASYFERLSKSITNISKNGNIVQRLQPRVEDFITFQLAALTPEHHSALNLDLCSVDQLETLIAAISSPARGPPFLISGPFGSGKTRILALVSHFLFLSQQDRQCTRILVCTQQHVSADTFYDCFGDLTERKDENLRVIRVVPKYFYGNRDDHYIKLNEFDSIKHDILRRSKVLIITTCSTAYSLFAYNHLPAGYFSHILIDEAAQVREPEAVGPLCFASLDTKIILAGDHHQVGPALLVLGEHARNHGLAVSLMERLHHLYTEVIKGEAQSYHKALTTSHRCAREILKLSEKLFYRTELKPNLESHPNAPFPLHFVCSSVENKLQPLETDTCYPIEAAVVVEQIRKWTAAWSKNVWGKKDFTEVAFTSPTRTQLYKIGTLLKDAFDKKYEEIHRSPTYDIQGKDYRVVILSTSEPTNADGSARDLTKSICNPFVFNTVISRARSLIVCVGNPYVLLRKEQHMVRQYGEKAKCWSNFLKLCFENRTFSVDPVLVQSTLEEVEWMCSPLSSIVSHFVGEQNPEELADMKG